MVRLWCFRSMQKPIQSNILSCYYEHFSKSTAVVLAVLKPRSLRSRCEQARLLQRLKGRVFPASSSCWGLQHPLGWGRLPQHLCPVRILCLPEATLGGSRAHPSPAQSHLSPSRNHIICKDFISKEDHSLRLHIDMNFGGTVQTPPSRLHNKGALPR